MDPVPTVGELRHTSCGNVYRLERADGNRRYVRRVSNGVPGATLWDADVVVYCWDACQWESIPLVGEDVRDYPAFGCFVGRLE